MDPNKTLEALRKAVSEFNQCCNATEGDEAAGYIVEHFEALDDWLSNGGFLPEPWGCCTTVIIESLSELQQAITDGVIRVHELDRGT